MNQVGMNFNSYANYSTNMKKLSNNNQTETPIKPESPQIAQTPAFKGGAKMNKNSIKAAFATLAGAIGLGSIMKAKKEEKEEVSVAVEISKEPIIGKNVDPKEAEILLNCWNNKNGGIKSINKIIERDCDGAYILVEFNNGQKVDAPIINTEENLVKTLKEYGLDYYNNNLCSQSLKELYNKTIDDYTTIIKQPENPIVLDKTELTTNPSDQDDFMSSKSGYTRSDTAKLLRFGENSLINEDKYTLNKIKYSIKSRLGIDNPSNIRAIKRFDSSNDTYIYYDKKTNLSTVFDKDGNIKGQVAFNTNYQDRGDEYPTDYKVYSIAINGDLRKFD